MKELLDAFYAGGLASMGFILFSAYNWALVILGFLHKARRTLIPVLGGAFGVMVVYAADRIDLCWIPLLLDPGCAALFVNGIWRILKKGKSGKQETSK